MSPSLDCGALLSGGSLRVVLYPDSSRPEVRASVESFSLPHLYIHEGRIIGISAYNHSWHLDATRYDSKLTAAYAYNNFCDLVFNASLALGVLRGYHASLYERIEFVTVRDFEAIWRAGENVDIDSVRNAVRAGRRLKVAIENDDGLTVVHPIHMAEVMLGDPEFVCFTDQTAHPAIFGAPSAIHAMSHELADMLLENMRNREPGVSAGSVQFDIPNSQFDSAYYIIKADGTVARGQNLGEELQFAKYRSITIFASRDPAA